MLPILNKGGSRLELNTLFIQPTYDCALNCPGCYVKAQKNQSGDLWLILKVFETFYAGVEAWANQITISCDVQPPYGSEDGKLHMSGFQYKVISKVMDDSRPYKPEIHLTFHDFKSYVSYGVLSSNVLNNIGQIAFSEIKTPHDHRRIRKLSEQVDVMYNHMLPSTTNSNNLKAWLKDLEWKAEAVKKVYLIMFKEPMGSPITEKGNLRRASSMANSIAAINAVFKYGSEALKKKVIIDGCLRDVLQHRKDQTTCSSNVSRFAVWPNGAISGCPYSARVQDASSSYSEVLEKIRKAQHSNDFREICTLPGSYAHITRRPRGSGAGF